MGLPPLDAGATHETAADESPAAARTGPGAVGSVTPVSDENCWKMSVGGLRNLSCAPLAWPKPVSMSGRIQLPSAAHAPCATGEQVSAFTPFVFEIVKSRPE